MLLLTILAAAANNGNGTPPNTSEDTATPPANGTPGLLVSSITPLPDPLNIAYLLSANEMPPELVKDPLKPAMDGQVFWLRGDTFDEVCGFGIVRI
jgi:hypothetical protein